MNEDKELAIIGVCVISVLVLTVAGLVALCIHTVDNLPFTGLY
jgi:hypothetical protein